MPEAIDETGIDAGLTVQSLVRGLDVIRAFDAEHPMMTASDVARRAGVSRAAVRRFLHTLRDEGYVRTDGKLFALAPRTLELGYGYLSGLGLPEMAQPHLQQLSDRIHQSCSVSVLDGCDITYVARAATRRIMSVTISIGTRFPAHATSMGRVLLAALPADDLERFFADASLDRLTSHTVTSRADLERELVRTRARGWCTVDQELEEGLRSIAAPLHAADGRVIAAINVATHAIGPATDFVTTVREPLLETAAAVDADLAMLPHRDPHPLLRTDAAVRPAARLTETITKESTR